MNKFTFNDIISIPTRKSDPSFEYNYFSILKFVFAIFIAIIHHNLFGSTFITKCKFFNFIALNGHSIVYLFFLISGVLFFEIYFKNIQDNKISFSEFIRKSFFKFYPIIFVTTILIYVLNWFYFNKYACDWIFCSRDPLKLLICLVFGGQSSFGLGYINNAPLWFLNVLLFIYPIAFLIAKTGKKSIFLCILMSFVGIAMLSSGISIPLFNGSFGEGVFPFFLGIVCAYLLRKTKYAAKSVICSYKICCLISIVILTVVFFFGFSSYGNNSILLTYFYFVPIIGVLYDIRKINVFFSKKIFIILEKLSLYIYFWNWPIGIVLFLCFNNTIPTFVNNGWFILLLLIIHIFVSLLSIYFKKMFSSFYVRIVKMRKIRE